MEAELAPRLDLPIIFCGENVQRLPNPIKNMQDSPTISDCPVTNTQVPPTQDPSWSMLKSQVVILGLFFIAIFTGCFFQEFTVSSVRNHGTSQADIAAMGGMHIRPLPLKRDISPLLATPLHRLQEFAPERFDIEPRGLPLSPRIEYLKSPQHTSQLLQLRDALKMSKLFEMSLRTGSADPATSDTPYSPELSLLYLAVSEKSLSNLFRNFHLVFKPLPSKWILLKQDTPQNTTAPFQGALAWVTETLTGAEAMFIRTTREPRGRWVVPDLSQLEAASRYFRKFRLTHGLFSPAHPGASFFLTLLSGPLVYLMYTGVCLHAFLVPRSTLVASNLTRFMFYIVLTLYRYVMLYCGLGYIEHKVSYRSDFSDHLVLHGAHIIMILVELQFIAERITELKTRKIGAESKGAHWWHHHWQLGVLNFSRIFGGVCLAIICIASFVTSAFFHKPMENMIASLVVMIGLLLPYWLMTLAGLSWWTNQAKT